MYKEFSIEHIRDAIEEGQEATLLKLFDEFGITSWDITPMQTFRLLEINDKLAELFIELIVQNIKED